MAWEPLVGTVVLLSRGKSRSCLGGSGLPGKVRSGRELGGSTGPRTAVLGMALSASQGGKWGLFLGSRRSCGGEAGTRKALAGRGRGSTGRYRRVLFQLAEYPACNKGTVRLPIPPTSVLAALRGSPAKFGFWISKFRDNKLGERRSGEEGS